MTTYELAEVARSMANEIRTKVMGFAAKHQKTGPFVAWVYPRKDVDGVIRTKIVGIPCGSNLSKQLLERLKMLGTYAWWVDPQVGDSKLLWALPLDIPIDPSTLTDKINEDIAKSVCETQPLIKYH